MSDGFAPLGLAAVRSNGGSGGVQRPMRGEGASAYNSVMKTLTTVLTLLVLPLVVENSPASALERELLGHPLAIQNAEVIVCAQKDYVIRFVESGRPIKRYAVSIWQGRRIILDDYEVIGSPIEYHGGDKHVYGFQLSGFRPMIGIPFARGFDLNENSSFFISYGEKFANAGKGAFVLNKNLFESDPVLGGYINGASCYIPK